jgi:WD40 repeat protein
LASFILPHGQPILVSASYDKTIRRWDPLNSVEMDPPMEGHTGWVTALATLTLSDRRILVVSGSVDATLRLWDPVTGECLDTLPLDIDVAQLASTGDRLIVGSDVGLVVLDLNSTRLSGGRGT